jgi:hypothetical protein
MDFKNFSLKTLGFKVFNPKTNTKMKHAKFSAILGRDVNVGEALSAEDLETIAAAIPSPTETASTATENGGASATASVEATTENPNQEVLAAIQSLTQKVDQGLAAVNSRIDDLEGTAGAQEATATPQNGTENQGGEKVPSYLDPNNKLNQLIDESLGK